MVRARNRKYKYSLRYMAQKSATRMTCNLRQWRLSARKLSFNVAQLWRVGCGDYYDDVEITTPSGLWQLRNSNLCFTYPRRKFQISKPIPACNITPAATSSPFHAWSDIYERGGRRFDDDISSTSLFSWLLQISLTEHLKYSPTGNQLTKIASRQNGQMRRSVCATAYAGCMRLHPA